MVIATPEYVIVALMGVVLIGACVGVALALRVDLLVTD